MINFLKKLFSFLGLTREEKTRLRKFALYSVYACIGIGVLAWAVQMVIISVSTKPAVSISQHKSQALFFKSAKTDFLPIDIEAHEIAAKNFLHADEPQKAIDHLLRILPYRKNDRAFILQLATAYLSDLKYADAFDLLTELHSDGTEDSLTPVVTARLGLTLYYLDKSNDAFDLLKQCLTQYPHSAEAACYLGQVEAAVNSTSTDAERHLLAAIALNRDYAEAWYQLARYYMTNGRFEKARTHLLRVLEIEPINEKAHSRLGMAYYYLNQPEMALKSYETALAINPHDYNTEYNLGELHYTVYNDQEKAFKEYKKALAEKPDHVQANFRVGLICLAQGLNKEAVEFFKTALRSESKNTRILLQLAVAYEKLGMNDEALGIYTGILKYDDLNEVARQKLELLSGK